MNKYFTKEDSMLILYQLEDILINISKFDCNIIFDENKKGGFFKYVKPSFVIIIGCDFLKNLKDSDFVSNKDFVYTVVTLFHEYQHALRNYEMYHNFQQGCEEIYVSSFTSAYFPYYYHLKYSMSPNELDAEFNGIFNAKAFFEEFYPEFDFEEALVERVNKLIKDDSWYGPFKEGYSSIFFFYEEIVDYLVSWQKFSYDFCPFLDIKDKDFQKTKECLLLDTNDSGMKHYDVMLKNIKENYNLSYEDKLLLNKLIDFSEEKVKRQEVNNEHTLYDDRISGER